MTRAGVTALVLAGQRGGTDPMAAAAGVSHKALLPVAGVPMILRVLSALRAVPAIERIVVSIESPEVTLKDVSGLDGVLLRQAGSSPARSTEAVFEEFGGPLLVTTADHALLTPAMVTHVLTASPPEAAATAALARRETIMAAFPQTKRTWLRFRDGAFSGCNLFFLARPEAAQVLRFWRRLEQQRKRPLAMARLLGVLPLLGYALGFLTLRHALKALERRCLARLAFVEMPFGAAAVDVDKAEDLALAEAVLKAGTDLCPA
ncbi:MAG: NTP transferase domain-containing protein [Acetobacteraceae bacterium]|nr:NTP transferase domain-containing protein [Acetobacteraceae bacterium]